MVRAGFRHGFTTRRGSLDFALGKGDPAVLRGHLAKLAATVGFAPEALHQAVQVHGRGLVVAGGAPDATLGLEADALVAEPGTGHAVAVRVADCVPVLLADPTSGRVAAAHAGWRGVEAGVLDVTLAHLRSAPGAGSTEQLLAAIGPCIGPCCFEVGADVGERIAKASTESVVVERRRGADGQDKMLVDLRLAARAQLEAAGLASSAIEDVPGRGPEGCTRCDDRFHSYRRDGGASGRLLGVIVAR